MSNTCSPQSMLGSSSSAETLYSPVEASQPWSALYDHALCVVTIDGYAVPWITASSNVTSMTVEGYAVPWGSDQQLAMDVTDHYMSVMSSSSVYDVASHYASYRSTDFVNRDYMVVATDSESTYPALNAHYSRASSSTSSSSSSLLRSSRDRSTSLIPTIDVSQPVYDRAIQQSRSQRCE